MLKEGYNMNTKKIVVIIAFIVVLAGGGIVFAQRQADTNKKNEAAAMKKTEDAAMMKKEADAKMMKDEESAKMAGDKMTDDKMSKDAYITYADYAKTKSAYTDFKKVIFFHASWCSICQGIEKEIKADPTKIPAKTVVIKADFDTSTELRQKYGVTQQYTFVTIDNDGMKLSKYSATSLDEVLAGLK